MQLHCLSTSGTINSLFLIGWHRETEIYEVEIACKEVKINGKLIYYKLKLQYAQSNVNFVSDLLFNGLNSLYPDM